MHLFVVPGHGAGDPGASGYGYDEAERVRALATRIKELGGDSVILADFGKNYYATDGWLTQDYGTDWQAVELHMDSAGAGARGAHVIYCGYSDPDAYDEELARRIAEFFPGRANRLVGRTDLKNPKQSWHRGIPYRLIENGFISDEGDLERFNAHLDDIARIYLEAFGIEPVEAVAGAQTKEHDTTTEDTMKVLTADDGTRWLLTADGMLHPIETDEEMWTCEGFIRKATTGDTFRRESAEVLARVVARTA